MSCVSTHSRPKAAGRRLFLNTVCTDVSTHSRPKAAGYFPKSDSGALIGFNTQPPEGGWIWVVPPLPRLSGFNTQPPEGGWVIPQVSLHTSQCFNTQPPEGGWVGIRQRLKNLLEFQHTAARRRLVPVRFQKWLFGTGFNTQPPEGGWKTAPVQWQTPSRFQHTAARRRLENFRMLRHVVRTVSTHSRPKAAGCCAWRPN